MKSKSYPAKLLLFGEYAILIGGEALAIPYSKHFSTWQQMQEFEIDPFSVSMQNFVRFIETNSILTKHLDIQQLKTDLNDGWVIHSTIPIGYGIGSSGSVIAAIYDNYKTGTINNIIDLKRILSLMEDFFHAKSSGLDPLVSYLNKAIHVSDTNTQVIDYDPAKQIPNYKIQLFDTGNKRSTKQLVSTFKKRMEQPEYKQQIQNIYLPLTQKALHHFNASNEDVFLDTILKLSQFQYQYFDFAIPLHIKEYWQEGIKTKNNIFKLCGAGGGGFMLTFVRN